MKKSNTNRTFLTIFLIVFWISIAFILAYSIIEKKYYYPVKYYKIIQTNSQNYNIEQSLILSIIKTESSYDKNAISPQGAKGLMQITDTTATFIANKLNIKQYDIFSPEINIEFGCYYLNYLLNKFKDTDTALISYNAGEGNVNNWLNNTDYSDDHTKLKIIPYKETSQYLKKIKYNQKRYKEIYNNVFER